VETDLGDTKMKEPINYIENLPRRWRDDRLPDVIYIS
jgi:hypothetical protein